jgi:hypothetical protein
LGGKAHPIQQEDKMDKTTRNLITGIFFLLTGLSLTTAVTLTAPQSARANPGVLYAAPVAQGSGNCSSWANACTLQTALAQAVSGDEIWVKMGVYYPGAAGNREATFTLKNSVALYGGFAGTEMQRNQRNWQTNLTILSGDIDQNDINADGNYIAETAADIQGNNVYHVVTGGGTNNTAVLDGFIITAGQANGSSLHNYGGGLYNTSSSPTLSNVTFSGNSAGSGGGMYNDTSDPTLINVTFSGNIVGFGVGGGMYNTSSGPTLTSVTFSDNIAGWGCGGMGNFDNSSPTLTNVIFSSNWADNYGGGMCNRSSSPTLTNVTFDGNMTDGDGGGMYNTSSSPTLTNVIFNGNKAKGYGGGMWNFDNSNPTLTNVIFNANSAESSGGGMRNYRMSSPILTNVIFNSNTANKDAGGMYNGYFSNPTLTNVTFSSNRANLFGGGIENVQSFPSLFNVIIWGNTATAWSSINNSESSPMIKYSDIQGCGGSGSGWQSACGIDGGHNIDADPLFVSATGSNLRLQRNSPCIDAGANFAVPIGVTTDLDGNPRIVDGNGDGNAVVDIGAYEMQINKVFLPLVLRNTP